jgi:iodotyrosine deiodinase
MKTIEYRFDRLGDDEQSAASTKFYEQLSMRRSVRSYAPTPVQREVIEQCILAASTAPSGANKQPYTFCIIEDPIIRAEIRKQAELEELRNYQERMNAQWLADLEPLGTDHNKPFITDAPHLVVLFKQVYGLDEAGGKHQHYYVNESVGIAAGMFIAALHVAGLATLTHTPSPMNFLERILNRPENERAYLVFPVGIPADGVQVPDIRRKPKEKIIALY